MSISASSYLGPYLVCKTHKVPSTETIRTCSDNSCEEYNTVRWGDSAKFCINCGTPIANRAKSIEIDNVNSGEIQQLIQESLCLPNSDSFWELMDKTNQHFWIANRCLPNARNFYSSSFAIVTNIVEITPESIQDEIQQFNLFFEKEIVLLRQEYGDENVSVHWGHLSWIS